MEGICITCHHGNSRYNGDIRDYDGVECLYPYSLYDDNWHEVKHKVIRDRWNTPRHCCCEFTPQRCYGGQ